jgi:hypothetical protein
MAFVDDATSRLTRLQFVASESAFDYFRSTLAYLEEHGKPVAFYSDKHGIFRANSKDAVLWPPRAPMLCMPIAARRRQPSLRYSDTDLAGFGVTDIPGQPAAPSASPVSRSSSGCRPRRRFAPISEPAVIVNMVILFFSTKRFESDEMDFWFPPC